MDAISERNLKGVFPPLVLVVREVASNCSVHFRVVYGLRTPAEQKKNVAKGVSQTMNSMHLPQKDGYGHAIDFAVLTGGKIDWFHISNYLVVVSAFKEAAAKHNVLIRCGADWTTLKDFGHIESPIKKGSS